MHRLRILSGVEEAPLGAESALRSLRLCNGAVIEDEFSMVRVALLWRELDEGRSQAGPDGLDAASALKAIARRAHS